MAGHHLLLLTILFTPGLGDITDNTPPVLLLDRKWNIPDTEPIGSVVTRVRGSDSEGDTLLYGLEHLNDFNVAISNNRPLPFVIDNTTGTVYTNETLKGRAGEQVYLYVTVSDGKLTHKTAVWVSIIGSSGVAPGEGDRPASVPLQLRPPMLSLPRILPPPATRLQPAYPFPSADMRPTPPPLPTTRSPAPTTLPEPNTTVAIPTVTTPQETSTAPPPAVTSPNMVDIALTIIPIVMICIMFAVAGIGAFLFRRRICRSKKAPKKEDMKKNSSGLREDPMVLQHWRGPRAFNNRYEAWDTDLTNIPPQEAPPAPEKQVDRWEFPRHRLKVFSILGEGCFGQVWKCEALDIDGKEGPNIVAVKTLKENAGERERTDLLQELQVMKMLEPHPNVVRLLGSCTEKDPLFVIMEYVPHGKLQSFLRNSRAQRCYDNMHGKSNTLTSRHLTSFCYQVAKGMQFLSSNGIIHRDLAARNVLVGENYTCKVADFGFARDVISSNIYERKSEGRLPIRWMAPESLYDNIFSVKSDIWSYGVLIWEIVTLGSTPYPGLSAAEVMKRVKDGYRLDKPEHCKRELYNIMYYCWEQEPKERPDFTEVVDLLEQLLLTETDYIELQHFPDHSYYNIVSLSGEKL